MYMHTSPLLQVNIQVPAGIGCNKMKEKNVHAYLSYIAPYLLLMNFQDPAGEGVIKLLKYVHAYLSFIAGKY